MVFAKEALNGIPLLEILFHAYIVSLLVVFCHFNHDYLDKYLKFTLSEPFSVYTSTVDFY